MIPFDKAGTIDTSQKHVLRHISPSYQEMMRAVFNLCKKNQFLESSIIPTSIHTHSENKLIFEHERIPFVTLPYEWSPFMYRDAGLFLLDLFLELSDLNLYISDIHPFNISFYKGKFCFLDFSAIEFGQLSKHLLKQFIYHYIHPTILFSKGEWYRVSALLNYFKVKIRHKDLMGYLNPLEKMQYLKYFIEYRGAVKLWSIRRTIQILKKWLLSYDLTNNRLGWGDYYKEDILTAFADKAIWKPKQKAVELFFDDYKPKTVLDIAGNAGLYSYHAASRGIQTICFDNECEAINRCYQVVKENQIKNLTPAVVDFIAPAMRCLHAPVSINNPIPTTLLSLQERMGKVDLILMLALVHHLVFSQHLTFTEVIKQAATFNSDYLCIEFPSPRSHNIRTWLQKDKENRFSWYREELFIQALEVDYEILSRIELEGHPPSNTKDGDSILFFCKKQNLTNHVASN